MIELTIILNIMLQSHRLQNREKHTQRHQLPEHFQPFLYVVLLLSNLRMIIQLAYCYWKDNCWEEVYYPARMRSRGKVVATYVCRRSRRHENRQISRSTRLS